MVMYPNGIIYIYIYANDIPIISQMISQLYLNDIPKNILLFLLLILKHL